MYKRQVVDSAVVLSVDKDADVPVIYSGVNVKNVGITSSSDHEALEVTVKETFPGAWNNAKDFTFKLPQGVYIACLLYTSKITVILQLEKKSCQKVYCLII